LLLSGARLASSDEFAVYLTTESLVERGELAIDPQLVQNGNFGRDGKFYYGAGIAQPLLSIPLYMGGKLLVNAIPVPRSLVTYIVRAAVSLLNQVFAGFIAVVMFCFASRLGYSKKVSLLLALSLLFASNLFPYLKSFMREPQILFYLLAAVYFLYCYRQDGKLKYIVYSGVLCGIGLLTRLTFVIALPSLSVYLGYILLEARNSSKVNRARPIMFTIVFTAPIIAAFGLNALYNYIQFGSVSMMPYAKAEFTTPLLVGVYGLLFSSGKSMFLFAPLCALGLLSLAPFGRKNRPELYLFVALFVTHVLFFGKFVAWAGDGSWGPRYLIPVLPFLILPVGALIPRGKLASRAALSLAALGLVVQIGGVSIYFGNYLREIGEFPYTKSFDDPEFLYKSHYVPNYSPVVGHWSMLLRNLRVHLSGAAPRFSIVHEERRIPLTEEEQSALLYTFDFWFMYAAYAGVTMTPVVIMAALLGLLTIIFGYNVHRTMVRDGPVLTGPGHVT
jgi:hypothetical protein